MKTVELIIKGTPFKLVWIPPGHFTMGSPESEKGRRQNLVHSMNIVKLIGYLQQIADKNPNAVVYVEDGCDPSDLYPITNIEFRRGCISGTADVSLEAAYLDEQPFNMP